MGVGLPQQKEQTGFNSMVEGLACDKLPCGGGVFKYKVKNLGVLYKSFSVV
jgi:hypothetical protein